jgi:hypothetical protein
MGHERLYERSARPPALGTSVVVSGVLARCWFERRWAEASGPCGARLRSVSGMARVSTAIGFSPSTAIGSPHRRPCLLPAGGHRFSPSRRARPSSRSRACSARRSGEGRGANRRHHDFQSCSGSRGAGPPGAGRARVTCKSIKRTRASASPFTADARGRASVVCPQECRLREPLAGRRRRRQACEDLAAQLFQFGAPEMATTKFGRSQRPG